MSEPRKIPVSALPDIRARRDAGETLRSIGASYGVSHVAVHYALTRPVSPQTARLAALERVAADARLYLAPRHGLPHAHLCQCGACVTDRDCDAAGSRLRAALAELDRTKP